MESQISKKGVIIDLGSNLTADHLAEYHQILEQAFHSNKKLIFKASELVKIDSLSFQLILSLVQSATNKKISWRWEQPSKTFLHFANLLGVKKILALTENQ